MCRARDKLAIFVKKACHWMGLFLACCTVLIEEVYISYFQIGVYIITRKNSHQLFRAIQHIEANNVPYVCILWPRWEHWFVFVFLSVFVFSLAKGRNRSGQRGTMVERNFEKRLVFAPQLLMRVDSL